MSGTPYTITASGAIHADDAISYVPGAPTVTPAPRNYTSPGGDVTVRAANGNLQILSGTTVASSTPLDDVASLTVNGKDGVANLALEVGWRIGRR